MGSNPTLKVGFDDWKPASKVFSGLGPPPLPTSEPVPYRAEETQKPVPGEPQMAIRHVIVVIGFIATVIGCIYMWNIGVDGWLIFVYLCGCFWALDAIEFERFK